MQSCRRRQGLKKALITGITGQDGSYLAELLLAKDYEIHGIYRRASVITSERIDHIAESDEYRDRFFGYYGDLSDSSSLNRIIEKVQPDEIYNLAAQSHVQVSFEVPEYTADVDGLGTLRILDGIRETQIKTKYYQASTSELFGLV
jgi:GDPmannose 4,6-dehydratase